MSLIEITVNGEKIKTQSDQTILEVISQHQLDNIPTLCHDQRTTAYGSCFLCVVEVKGINRLVPSCCTLIKEGMEIITKSEQIIKARKTALELLLSNHYADCMGPCKNNCPAGVDAQGYISLISQNKYHQAVKLIKENNPLPLSIGRICVRDCELACRRNLVDQPVGINYLKRFSADIDIDNPWTPSPSPPLNKKIAIIGGGPSGLTCAYYLNLYGYQVTIFEKLPELGGMLRYGIPSYRLPKDVLDQEISWIVNQGIEVELNCEFGVDLSLPQLTAKGYEAVFLAPGAQNPRFMKIPGEQSQGVLFGVEWLRSLHTRGIPSLQGKIVVVGGGNTAIDTARTALRCGADSVVIIYRRSRKEMPANDDEIKAAYEEGIEFKFLTNPVKINTDHQGKISSVTCMKMKLVETDAHSRPKPVPLENSEFSINCQGLVSAIGQVVDTQSFNSIENLKINFSNTILVDQTTLETSVPGLFAGGDAVTGPWTAIGAIAQGKRAAISIDQHLTDRTHLKLQKPVVSLKQNFQEVTSGEYSQYPRIAREKMPELNIDQRIDNFDEVELGLTAKQAKGEVLRCLQCGCSQYHDCQLIAYARDYEIDITRFSGDFRRYPVDKRHPFIILDPNKCINCGKCVRTCSEILKVSAIEFIHRGFRAIVKPAMEKALLDTNCISCGNCIDVCPTGAITENLPLNIAGTLPRQNKSTLCNYCSLCCQLNYQIVDDQTYYVANRTDEVIQGFNQGYLCVKGRFGYRFNIEEPRINKPVIKRGHQHIETEYREAFDHIADKLNKIIQQHGKSSIALFGSPKLSNESLYLIGKLGRAVIGTNNIACLSHLVHNPPVSCLNEGMGITTSTACLEDLAHADVIVALNAGLNEENLIMELQIKQAQKRGTKLVLVSCSEEKLTKFADLWINSVKGTNTLLMDLIIGEIISKQNYPVNHVGEFTRGFESLKKFTTQLDLEKVSSITGVYKDKINQMINWLSPRNNKVVFIYNLENSAQRSANDVKSIFNYLALTNRLQGKGNGLLLFKKYSNSSGIIDMGIHPQYLPGMVKKSDHPWIDKISQLWGCDLENLTEPVDISEKLIQGKIKAALIFQEDPLRYNENIHLFNNLEFLVAADYVPTFTTREADVVLPLKYHLEQSGTYTSCDNRIQKVNPIINHAKLMDNYQIICELGKRFNPAFTYNSSDQVFQEIKKANRFYTKAQFNKSWSKHIFNNHQYLTPDKKLHFMIYDIDLTTYPYYQNELLSHEIFYNEKIKSKLSI
ncbi:MAG: FAD-dependent oxidoreductase [bacterium]